jgi:ABC-type uncharacterized transport system ATPase subunit
MLLDGSLDSIRSTAERTVVVDYDGDGAQLLDLPGVIRINDAGRHAELSLGPEADTQRILALLMQRFTIRRFDTREASLHEIFVRAVGGDDAR